MVHSTSLLYEHLRIDAYDASLYTFCLARYKLIQVMLHPVPLPSQHLRVDGCEATPHQFSVLTLEH